VHSMKPRWQLNVCPLFIRFLRRGG